MDLVLILIILVVLYLIFLHIYYSDSNLTLQYRIPESRSVISDTVFNTNVGKVSEMKSLQETLCSGPENSNKWNSNSSSRPTKHTSGTSTG